MALKEPKMRFASVKMFINDVLKLEKSTDVPNLFVFCGRKIRIVDIMGIVIECKSVRGDFSMYKIDDGTGVIVCIHNHMNPKMLNLHSEVAHLEAEMKEMASSSSESVTAMQQILGETRLNLKEKLESLKQGDCAQIQGFICDFDDKREIRAFSICKVSNSRHEIDRVYEMGALYSRVYDRVSNDDDIHALNNSDTLSVLYSKVHADVNNMSRSTTLSSLINE